MQAKLLADTVRVLTQQVPPARETTIFDTVLPRFALRVRPPAAPGRPWPSFYFVRYVGPDGREQKAKVGSPATMDLDEARRAAKALLAIVDRGGDPSADKAARRARWSVPQAAEAYLASPEFARKADKTRAGDRSTLTNHIAHHLGTVPLASIDVPAVRRLLRAVETDTRANVRHRRLGGAGASRKVARVLSALCTWAVGEGQLNRNPLIGSLRLTGDGQRESVITTAEEYARLFGAMDELVTAGTLRAASRAFITVAALTGMRRGELQALRWRQVDLVGRRITLTGTKGARLARTGLRTEAVSLPPFAAAALGAIRPDGAAEDDRVFLAQRDGARIEVNRDWQRVRAKAGLPPDLALHSLRHSIGTVGVMNGLSGPEVQKLLRHRNIGTTAKYVHLADQVRLQDRAIEGMAPAVAADVAEPLRFVRSKR
jgi:integrase